MTYDIAKYLPDPKTIERIEGVLRDDFGTRSVVRGHDILHSMDGLVPGSFQKALLDLLKEAGVLKVIKSSADIGKAIYAIEREKSEDFFTSEIRAAEVLSKVGYKIEKQEQNVRIVATLPEDWKRIPDIDPTDEAIRRIIIRAKKDLWIVSPYFDEFGKSAFENSLIGRARNRVCVRVIGRQLAPSDADNFGSIKSLQRLMGGFKSEGLEDFIKIREFTCRNAATGETEAGLHSKIVIADEEVCYIGSANMTRWSLSRNFEMGVELTGEMVIPVVRLVQQIWDESSAFSP